MCENLRFNGKILFAKIFTKGGKWFVSIAVELSNDDIVKTLKANQVIKTNKSMGIDLGITDLTTLSNGEKQAPKPLKIKLNKLQDYQNLYQENKKAVKTVKKQKLELNGCLIKSQTFVKTFCIN